MKKLEKITLFLLVLTALLSRLLPHWPNMTAIGAAALFSGACIRPRVVAILFPLALLALTDVMLGFHSTMVFTYGGFAMVSWLSALAMSQKPEEISWPRLGSLAFLGSLIFFVVSNLGVWLVDGLYPRTWEGLAACYVAAIPFFGNEVIGDLVYTALLFGAWAVLSRRLFRSRLSSRFI